MPSSVLICAHAPPLPNQEQVGSQGPAHRRPQSCARPASDRLRREGARREGPAPGYRDRRLWNPGHTARHLWKLSPKSRFGCPPTPNLVDSKACYVSPPRHLSIRQTRVGVGEGRELQRASRFYSCGVGQLANQEAYRACDVTWRWAIDVPRPPLQPRPRLLRRGPASRSRSRPRQRPEGGQ